MYSTHRLWDTWFLYTCTCTTRTQDIYMCTCIFTCNSCPCIFSYFVNVLLRYVHIHVHVYSKFHLSFINFYYITIIIIIIIAIRWFTLCTWVWWVQSVLPQGPYTTSQYGHDYTNGHVGSRLWNRNCWSTHDEGNDILQVPVKGGSVRCWKAEG